jgi:hypothetical protein
VKGQQWASSGKHQEIAIGPLGFTYNEMKKRIHTDDLKKTVANAILPKMGITSEAPRAVVLGTARYGGIGLDHLAAVQSHGQLQYLCGHLRCKDTTGQLIRMIMDFTQMKCGCTGKVFEQSYKQYDGAVIGENWITAIWVHLERCKATVKITGLWKPTHGRENDNVIMERITASGRFRPVEILEINICILNFQVFFTSDITYNSGKNLEPWVLKGQIQSTRKSTWEWSVQQRPTSWKAWKQARHVQRLMGDIGEFQTTRQLEVTK